MYRLIQSTVLNFIIFILSSLHAICVQVSWAVMWLTTIERSSARACARFVYSFKYIHTSPLYVYLHLHLFIMRRFRFASMNNRFFMSLFPINYSCNLYTRFIHKCEIANKIMWLRFGEKSVEWCKEERKTKIRRENIVTTYFFDSILFDRFLSLSLSAQAQSQICVQYSTIYCMSIGPLDSMRIVKV